MSNLQNVKPGDPLRISTATFNAFIDAARDFQARARGLARGRAGWKASARLH